MASLIAAVSSVLPSPVAPKSLTFLKTVYDEGSALPAAWRVDQTVSSTKYEGDRPDRCGSLDLPTNRQPRQMIVH